MEVNDTDIWDLSETTRVTQWHNKAKSGAAEALKAIYEERRKIALIKAMEDEAKRIRQEAEVLRLAAIPKDIPYTPSSVGRYGIIQDILNHRGVTHKQLKNGGRMPDIVRARREIAYWLRMRTSMSWSQIIAQIGLKNTSSALYLVNKHAVLHGLPVPPTGNRLDCNFDPSIAELAPSIVRKIMGTAKPTGVTK